MAQFDFFISYSSADKEEVARPLAVGLAQHKFSVWYDDFELRPGDSVSEKIEYGIANSSFAIIVVSKTYFDQPWATRELRGFVSKETLLGHRALIPLLHGVDRKFLVAHAPTLADIFSLSTNIGTAGILERIFSLFKSDIRSERSVKSNQGAVKYHQLDSRDDRLNLFDKNNFEAFCTNFDGTKYRGYTVTLFDIDKLTQINKRYSSRIGNYILSMVFKILDGHARNNDFFCRCGDDTFCLINPDISEKVASERVKKMLCSVEAFNWSAVCKDLHVSCSAGFATKGRLEPLRDTVIRAAIGMNAAKSSAGASYDSQTKKPSARKPKSQLLSPILPFNVKVSQGPMFLYELQSRNFSDYWS